MLRRHGAVLWVPHQWSRLVAAGVATVVTLVLIVPFVDILFVFAQPRPGNPDSQLLWMAGNPIATVALTALLEDAMLRTPDAAP